MSHTRTAAEVFDDWAVDYHARGMEDKHWASVHEAFELIPESSGHYLEVGVGNGYSLFYMATNQYRTGHCMGIDVSANMVDITQQRIVGVDNAAVRHGEFLEFDPGPDRPDLIFSMEVFYYLPDIQKGIEHAFEVLAPGGMLMILVNYYEERLESHDWPGQLDTRMQLWSRSDYLEGLKEAGFTDVKQELFEVPADPDARAKNPGTLGTWGRKPE
ncbi:MAG: class I SAM-dependent methyltransferase [Rhodothermia bacterium]